MKAILGRLAAFLTRFNTHPICWSGIIFGVLSLGVIGAHKAMDAWCYAHLDGFAFVAVSYIEGLYAVAFWVAWPALLGAAFGRPWNIPGGPPRP